MSFFNVTCHMKAQNVIILMVVQFFTQLILLKKKECSAVTVIL